MLFGEFPVDVTSEVPEIVEIPMDVTPEVPEATNDISVLSDLSMDSDEVEDRTFNVTNREINQPNVPIDVSLRERPLDTVITEDGRVTYEVVTGGTKRGGKILISSDGHSYTETKRRSAMPTSNSSVNTSRRRWVGTFNPRILVCKSRGGH